jgi:GNAT superfamily N-acetyltransferase
MDGLGALYAAWGRNLNVPVETFTQPGTHLIYQDSATIRPSRCYVYCTDSSRMVLIPDRLYPVFGEISLHRASGTDEIVTILNETAGGRATLRLKWRDFMLTLPDAVRSQLKISAYPQVRILSERDGPALEALNAALSDEERELARISIHDYRAVGWFEADQMAAAASFLEEDGLLDIGVMTHPAFRGRGLGRAVVAALCARARPDMPLQYSTQETNPASYQVARQVGFVEFLQEEGIEVHYA